MATTTTELATPDKPRRLQLRIRGTVFCLLLMATTPTGSVFAQQHTIHRCIGSNGEPTFRDQECDQPAQDQAHAANSDSISGMPSAMAIPPTQTCPVSAEDLLRRTRLAFDSRQAVAFSGLILWNGMGQNSSVAALRELAVLVNEPLISIDLEYQPWANASQSRQPRLERETPSALGLVVRTVSEHDNQVPYESVVHFDVTNADGCWWLLMPW